jgi:hypothetical protein
MNSVQYPPDPSSSTTGQSGILVFNDSAPTQGTPARSQAVLGSNGIATFTQNVRTMNVFANLAGLTDAPTRLVVSTTVGNESVGCNESSGRATCTGTLIGDPELGGVALLVNNGRILSKGTIASTQALLVTGILFDVGAPGTASLTLNSGSSFFATFSGSNFPSQTYFDVRFQAPGSSVYIEALNWQTGPSASHNVRFGTTTGTWTISGVRAHQDPTDHSGNYVAVSGSITVQ